jgi:PAS domain S-box-containing protein
VAAIPIRHRTSRFRTDPETVADALLSAVTAASHDAIVCATRGGAITDWNPAATRLFGLPAERAVGQSLAIVFPPEKRAETNVILARVRRGEWVELPWSVPRETGADPVEIVMEVAPVRDELEEIVAILAIGRRRAAPDAQARELAESEARFDAVFADSPVGIVLARPNGDILAANPACCAMLGYPDSQQLSGNVHDITHPDDLETSLRVMARALGRSDGGFVVSQRWLRADGTAMPVALNGRWVYDAHGSPRWLVAHVRNVAPAPPPSAVLEGARQDAQLLLECISDAAVKIDRTWRLTALNAAATALLGRPRRALAGIDVRRAFPPLAEASVQHVCARAVAQGSPATIAWHRPTDDRRFEVRLIPNADGLWLICRDVTAATRPGEELRHAEARFRTLVEQLPVAVYEVAADETESVLYFSPGFEEMFGVTVEDAQSRPEHWLDYVHPDDRARVQAVNDTAIATGERFEAEFRARRGDGAYIWVQDVCAIVRGPHGEPVSGIGLMINISERKQLESELRAALDAAEAADRARSHLLTAMNRDLRSPLQAVAGYADALLTPGAPLPDRLASDIAHIRQAARRMIDMIDGMDILTRLEAGQMTLSSIPVDVIPIMERVGEELAPLAAAKGLELRVALPKATPRVLADPGATHRILLHLVDHAIAFTAQGSVRIGVERSRQGVAVAVSDTGVGIPEEVEDRGVAELREWTSGLSRQDDRAGLGLTIARKLAEAQGGQIGVRSHPGIGSTFTLHLPPVRHPAVSMIRHRLTSKG